MVHFLATGVGSEGAPSLSLEGWRHRVDRFRVEDFCDRLETAGVGHLIFTVGQNSGFYAAPNKRLSDLIRGQPGGCSERDLIGEIAAGCSHRGINFIVYVPSHPPTGLPVVLGRCASSSTDSADWTPDESTLTRMHKPDGGNDPVYFARRMRMLECWTEVIREWSERWGESVKGWWIDGCYLRELFLRATGPNSTSLAEACRAGNPSAAVAMAKGHRGALDEFFPGEDFTAGECIDRLWIGGWFGTPEFQRLPDRLRSTGQQVHLLHFLGEFWGRAGSSLLTGDIVKSYSRFVRSNGAAVTWDVPVDATGVFSHEIHTLLRDAAGSLLAKNIL